MYCSVSFGVYQCHVSPEVLNFEVGKWGQRLFMCILVIKFTGAASCCSVSGLLLIHCDRRPLRQARELEESVSPIPGQYSAKKFCSLMENKYLDCTPKIRQLFTWQWLKSLSICFAHMLCVSKILPVRSNTSFRLLTETSKSLNGQNHKPVPLHLSFFSHLPNHNYKTKHLSVLHSDVKVLLLILGHVYTALSRLQTNKCKDSTVTVKHAAYLTACISNPLFCSTWKWQVWIID